MLHGASTPPAHRWLPARTPTASLTMRSISYPSMPYMTLTVTSCIALISPSTLETTPLSSTLVSPTSSCLHFHCIGNQPLSSPSRPSSHIAHCNPEGSIEAGGGGGEAGEMKSKKRGPGRPSGIDSLVALINYTLDTVLPQSTLVYTPLHPAASWSDLPLESSRNV